MSYLREPCASDLREIVNGQLARRYRRFPHCDFRVDRFLTLNRAILGLHQSPVLPQRPKLPLSPLLMTRTLAFPPAPNARDGKQGLEVVINVDEVQANVLGLCKNRPTSGGTDAKVNRIRNSDINSKTRAEAVLLLRTSHDAPESIHAPRSHPILGSSPDGQLVAHPT
jgi:hypothetical protein